MSEYDHGQFAVPRDEAEERAFYADNVASLLRHTGQRLQGILTPAITVFMGAVVATTIASIMSAILGFNDLALAP